LSGCTVGVWRTDDGGGTWSQLPAPNMFAEPGTGLYCQGGYDNVTAVDPSNPDVAYIGGIDLWKITGAGATFANITNYFGGYPPVRVHPDYHSIAFVGNSSGFYVGNDGGVWSSGDGGASSSTVAAETPAQIVSSIENLVTQWKSAVTSALGRPANSA